MKIIHAPGGGRCWCVLGILERQMGQLSDSRTKLPVFFTSFSTFCSAPDCTNNFRMSKLPNQAAKWIGATPYCQTQSITLKIVIKKYHICFCLCLKFQMLSPCPFGPLWPCAVEETAPLQCFCQLLHNEGLSYYAEANNLISILSNKYIISQKLYWDGDADEDPPHSLHLRSALFQESSWPPHHFF